MSCGGSKWRQGGSPSQWRRGGSQWRRRSSQWQKVKSQIRIRIKAKGWIRVQIRDKLIKLMRIRNTACHTLNEKY
jgi:hypothetical protein